MRQILLSHRDDLADAQLLPLNFKIAFTDADPESNRALNECEEGLFLNPNESEVVPLAGLIRKTELQGELYDTVAFGQQTVTYPRPFLFTTQPQDGHFSDDPEKPARILVCTTTPESTSSPAKIRQAARSRDTWRGRGRSFSCSIPPRTRGSGPSVAAVINPADPRERSKIESSGNYPERGGGSRPPVCGVVRTPASMTNRW